MEGAAAEGESAALQPEPAAALDAETASSRLELEAFVAQSVPQYCQQLSYLLQNVTACLDGAFTATANQSDKSLQYGDTTLFDNDKVGFKGGFSLRKHQVVKANIEICFKKFNRGNPIKTSIGSVPFTVPQLENARNFCELALEELEETMSWPELSFTCVSLLADNIWEFVKLAHQELCYPAKYIFPFIPLNYALLSGATFRCCP